MLLEAFVHFTLGSLNIGLSFSLKPSLNFLEFLKTLVSEGKVLFPHASDQEANICSLFFESFRILIIFLLKFFPKLIDKLILGSHYQFEGFLLFLNSLGKRLTLLVLFQLGPLDLQSGILFIRRNCLLLDSM